MPIIIAQRLNFFKWDATIFQESQLEVTLGEIGKEAEVGKGCSGERGEWQWDAVVWQRP